MHSKVLNDSPERTYAVIFDTGEEVASGLRKFALDNNLGATRFTAIGAFSRVTLGYFDWQTKQYEKIPLNEQVEVLSLIGDVALDGTQPQIHAHVVVEEARRHRARWTPAGSLCAPDAGGGPDRITELPRPLYRSCLGSGADRHRKGMTREAAGNQRQAS